MPRVSCPCGESVPPHAVPHPQTFALIWEPDEETLLDELLTAHREAGSAKAFQQQAYVVLSRHAHARRNPEVIECDHCGRLLVFPAPGAPHSLMIYVSEAAHWQEPYSLRAFMEGRSALTD